MSLLAAIESVLSQEGVHAIPLVVLNGRAFAAGLESELRADSRLRVIERADANLPGALLAGRGQVETPWFGTLDDDDILLPGALATRVAALDSRPDRDVVVTNSFTERGAHRWLSNPSDFDVASDPLRALMRRNWLSPGSWLARSAAVGEELFDRMPRYGECTYLAVRFASEYRMQWLAQPTVVYRVGSPRAESLSPQYVHGQADVLRCLLELKLPDDVRLVLRSRIPKALHHAAEIEWRHGDIGLAWQSHLASLAAPGGWRHIAFTRHLVRASWHALRGSADRRGL